MKERGSRPSNVFVCNSELQRSPWKAIRGNEVRRSLPHINNSRGRHANDLDDARNLVRLVLAGKQRSASQQLGQDTPNAPHVDCNTVACPEDDLGSPVEPRLDVGVDTLVVVTARSKVNHLWCTSVHTLLADQQYTVGMKGGID